MYREHLMLGRGFIVEIVFSGATRWKLSLKKGGKLLVQYGSGIPYAFKSVEQLRYDFERDVENAQRQGR
jgi:hypothetical protein